MESGNCISSGTDILLYYNIVRVDEVHITVFRLSEWCSWSLVSSGMWHSIAGLWVPNILRPLCSSQNGTHYPVTWYHVPEDQRPQPYKDIRISGNIKIAFSFTDEGYDNQDP